MTGLQEPSIRLREEDPGKGRRITTTLTLRAEPSRRRWVEEPGRHGNATAWRHGNATAGWSASSVCLTQGRRTRSP